MATSYGALCTDFYINQKLSLKLDLPTERETILHLFDRIRKSQPNMERFRRFENELVLESARKDGDYRWMSLRRSSIRTGHVNPPTMEEAYNLHRLVLDVVPYYLTISPLDVDYIEMVFGFDLECKANHDEVVFDALFNGSPVANLMNFDDEAQEGKIVETQPLFGTSLNRKGDLQAYFDVKTRTRSRRGDDSRYEEEPISLFLSVRKYGPIDTIEDLPKDFDLLRNWCEKLATDKLLPDLLQPIARQITSVSG